MKNKVKVLETRNLSKYYPVSGGKVLKAVDDVSIELYEGETLGIVGESGSGKTTLGKLCLGITEKSAGEIIVLGKNIDKLDKKSKKDFTKNIQMIFQDPYSSLDPTMSVFQIISEGLEIHNIGSTKEERIEIVKGLLKDVGLNQDHINRKIHEFSGGQRQRIGIARALAIKPKILVCDEPISALDVSMRAQVINLLINLEKSNNISSIFIAHDLAVVKHISDRVAVMYLGEVVEISDSDDIYKNPYHPYTKALLSAIPIADPEKSKERKSMFLKGEIPSPVEINNGCKFYSRCMNRMDICKNKKPERKEVSKDHSVLCHLY